jgi:hypothetical protein
VLVPERLIAMILALCFRLAASIHWYLYAYAPSNILIRYLRSSTGGRWAFPISAALTAGYLAATVGLTSILESGGPGWLNLVTLVCAWNAMKFMLMGVVSLPMLFRAALRDHRAQREVRAQR